MNTLQYRKLCMKLCIGLEATMGVIWTYIYILMHIHILPKM